MSFIAGIIVSYIVPPIIDSIFPKEFYITISVIAILFPIVTFLSALKISPGRPPGRKSGFILLAYVFTLGMVYLTVVLAHEIPPYLYVVHNYVFYTIGCLVNLVIVLRLKPNPIRNKNSN